MSDKELYEDIESVEEMVVDPDPEEEETHDESEAEADAEEEVSEAMAPAAAVGPPDRTCSKNLDKSNTEGLKGNVSLPT